jgi:hypothetical protein
VKKTCSKCGIEKKFSDFHHYRRNECKACCVARALANYHARLSEKRECKACGIEKELRDFNRSHAVCKVCRSERRREAASARVLTGDEKLKAIDLVPCSVCSLRGHEPGDPDKCLGSSKLYQRGAGGAGIGGMWWV